MTPKILITGSNGFIGSHLAKKLIRLDNEVFKLPRSSSLDITDFRNLSDIPPHDIVYHLAGITGYIQDPLKIYHVNITGTLNTLEWCRINDVKKMIFSSTYVYGSPIYLPIDENHPLSPNSPYSRSKLFGENLCQAYHEDYGLNIAILRFFNVYGCGQNMAYLIPSIIKQCFSGKITVRDPTPKRDFIYIDDVVSACLKVKDIDISYETFNIGYGVSYSVEEIATLIKDIFQNITGKMVEIQFVNERKKNEIMDTVADITKSRTLLGWEPGIDMKTGVEKTVRGYLSEVGK